MLYYQWGLNEKEIGACFGFTESRASQIKARAEARVQTFVSSEESRVGEREKQAKVLQEVQGRLSLDDKTQRILEKIRSQAKRGLAQDQKQEIPETLFGSFRVEAF